MKNFLRHEGTYIMHEGYFMREVLPRLKREEASRTGVEAKYKNYYDIRETKDFKATDTSFAYRNDRVLLVNVYIYYEDEA